MVLCRFLRMYPFVFYPQSLFWIYLPATWPHSPHRHISACTGACCNLLVLFPGPGPCHIAAWKEQCLPLVVSLGVSPPLAARASSLPAATHCHSLLSMSCPQPRPHPNQCCRITQWEETFGIKSFVWHQNEWLCCNLHLLFLHVPTVVHYNNLVSF